MQLKSIDYFKGCLREHLWSVVQKLTGRLSDHCLDRVDTKRVYGLCDVHAVSYSQ